MTGRRRGTTIVTGASSGIGRAFAEHFAAQGHPVVLVARREHRLRALATDLSQRFGVDVGFVVADLGTASGRQVLRRAADCVDELEVIVAAAGFGAVGDVADLSRERQAEMVAVNCEAVVDLTVHVLPRLLAQRNGTIIVVSSAAAWQPIPTTATYAATKAFDLFFAEALANECRGTGVRVIASCPGPTKTEFGEVAGGVSVPSFLPPYTAERAVRATVRALNRGRVRVAAGPLAKLTTTLATVLPRRVVVAVAGLIHRRVPHGPAV